MTGKTHRDELPKPGESWLFKPYEIRAMERRLKGDKSDKDGTYSARAKPKLLELLTWFKKKGLLKELLGDTRK